MYPGFIVLSGLTVPEEGVVTGFEPVVVLAGTKLSSNGIPIVEGKLYETLWFPISSNWLGVVFGSVPISNPPKLVLE